MNVGCIIIVFKSVLLFPLDKEQSQFLWALHVCFKLKKKDLIVLFLPSSIVIISEKGNNLAALDNTELIYSTDLYLVTLQVLVIIILQSTFGLNSTVPSKLLPTA